MYLEWSFYPILVAYIIFSFAPYSSCHINPFIKYFLNSFSLFSNWKVCHVRIYHDFCKQPSTNGNLEFVYIFTIINNAIMSNHVHMHFHMCEVIHMISFVEDKVLGIELSCQDVSVQFSHVRLFETPWTAARQASLSITNSWSLLCTF